MTHTSTIIIGAGAAGLAAAASLAAAHEPYLILEARDRVGGRVDTVHDPRWPLPLEFGAEFIHGRPKVTWDLVHHAGLRAYDVADEHWQSKDGKPQKHSEGWSGLDEIMRRLARVGQQDLTFLDFLHQHCADISGPAIAMAKAFVEGLDAADASLVSARSIGASEKDGETFDADTPFRLFDGYDKFLNALAQPIPAEMMHLKTIVRSIHWSRGQVAIQTTDGRKFEAARAIITLPIGVLLAAYSEPGAVDFKPPLPEKMHDAIHHMRMGPVIKVLLHFYRAFWEEGPWRDMAFLHSPGSAFPTWWTMLPCRAPMLTAWAGGPAAQKLSHLPPAQVLDAAVETLACLMGVDPNTIHTHLAGWHVSDWQSDPFARGAYAFATVGGADAAEQMSQPVDETLYFAGEATHPGYAGTVAAAIASGRRAAAQITSRFPHVRVY
jgi:monoamine oxidase